MYCVLGTFWGSTRSNYSFIVSPVSCFEFGNLSRHTGTGKNKGSVNYEIFSRFALRAGSGVSTN